MKNIIKFNESIGVNLGDDSNIDYWYTPPPLEPKPKITVVIISDSYWAALYVDGELKTDCSDGEGYAYGEVLKAVNLEYKTIEITNAELGKKFPKKLKTLKDRIEEYRRPKNPEIDPYGEEDWEEEKPEKKEKFVAHAWDPKTGRWHKIMKNIV